MTSPAVRPVALPGPVRDGLRSARRLRLAMAGLLAVACLVSVASGFFDGGLRNAELGAALFTFQLFLLAVTAGVGVLAAARAVVLLRERRRSS